MTRKPMILVGMFVLLFTFTTASYAQEAITIGVTVTGELDDSIDTYSFDVVTGDLFVISVESDEFDPLTEVFNSDDNRVGSDDDSGSDTNALFSFIAQEGATYTFTVGSYFGEATGAYTATVTQMTPVSIDYDSTATLETDGANPIFAVVNGMAGDVLNIWAISANEQDTQMRLIAPDGEEVANDDETGRGSNPYLRRIELPLDGAYLIQIETWFDEPLSGTIDVTVETTESLPLTSEVASITLGDGFDKEYFTLDVEAGSVYRITVVSASSDNSINVEVLGSDGWAEHSMTTNGAAKAMMEFIPNASGTMRVELDSYFYFDETGIYEINVETVE